MKGFEIKKDGKTIVATTKEGVVTIVFSSVKTSDQNEIYIDVSGLDTTNNETHKKLKWFSEELKTGDEFRVKIIDIDE